MSARPVAKALPERKSTILSPSFVRKYLGSKRTQEVGIRYSGMSLPVYWSPEDVRQVVRQSCYECYCLHGEIVAIFASSRCRVVVAATVPIARLASSEMKFLASTSMSPRSHCGLDHISFALARL